VKYADIAEILPQIKEILVTESVPLAQKAGQGGVQFISLERWGTLLVFAAEKQWIDRVRFWVDLMDKPLKTNEKRYFIYFPENSRALDLMQTLENILGLAGDSDSGARQPEETDFLSSLYRSISDTDQTDQNESNPSTSSRPARDKSQTSSSSPSSGGQSESRIEGIGGLAVDETRNALVVYATVTHYQAIERLLQQLDIMPPQVLIEAMVAEVTLVDDLKYGMEWYFKNTGGGQRGILSTLGGLGLASAGISLSSVTDSGKFQVMVQALAEEELVQVLSSPRIVVQDGKSATINVGTQVPVVTAETASIESTSAEGTGVVRNYQYRDTGVILKISPVVHARGIVTLKIDQDVSEPSPSGGENPLILHRTLSTEVVGTSGQTLVIGGLIKESKGYKESKVPFFGDLPGVGHLFKNNTRGNDRTELVVMITPHIIRGTQEIDDIRRVLFEEFRYLRAPDEN
jgi:general secretion pathway protein D